MKLLHKPAFNILCLNLFFILLILSQAFSYQATFSDSRKDNIAININKRPSAVVSLVPSITEIIFRLGAGDAVKGITYHSACLPQASGKEIVGGFFSPSLPRIEEINPDIIFVSDLHKKVIEKFGSSRSRLINLETNSIESSFNNIYLLGKIFDKQDKAEQIVAGIKKELLIIKKKTALIPISNRKRVVRLMGQNPVMVPGDDSFQNDMIRHAGGIPPVLGRKGNAVVITKEEWMSFNPQVIYICGKRRQTEKTLFDAPGWKDVDAVKNGLIYTFPCDLTCRAATNTGCFVSWLSSKIYGDEFAEKKASVFEEKIYASRKIDIVLDYIKDARISYSRIDDFENKTLIIDFKHPLTVVSTLEGERRKIKSVGNHYSPPPCWAMGHKRGLDRLRSKVYDVVGKSENSASFLFTGADMDNLTVKTKSFKDMKVYALATAGVESNAVRMSSDEGRFYEPGTINIILLPNMKLTPRAMTRAIISATEGKTAALQDLDIRSSYSSQMHQATGTGTDNIIAVQGTGVLIDNAGGHSKMGELIAKAVYEAVREAVCRQNGLVPGRSVFRRLKERNISIYTLVSGIDCECNLKKSDFAAAVEKVLLNPEYAGFVEFALALSDDYENGLVKDLSVFNSWSKTIAESIAGNNIDELKSFLDTKDMPVVLKTALNAIFNGVFHYGT